MSKLIGMASLIVFFLGSIVHADDKKGFSIREVKGEARASPSRSELIRLLVNPSVNKNYIPIAAHRAQVMGSNLPENSLSAINNANRSGVAEILELDIKITSDAVPYLMHDSYLQRTTNFVDTTVGDYGDKNYGASSKIYPWSVIKNLYLKNIDGTYSNEHPATFEEVLIWVRDNTNMLINLDINEPEVFEAVWNIVKNNDAFDICIFKGRYSYEDFKYKYYDKLDVLQKNELMYFPIIPDPDENNPTKPIDFYNSWEERSPSITKGYEVGYKKDNSAGSWVEREVLKVVSAIREKRRVRVHVFSAMPDNYRGRYIGNVNINQCCNATVDSRGDLEYLLDPYGKRDLSSGADGYIITDDSVNLNRYLDLLGKRDLSAEFLRRR